ncbi:HECT-domain-containing protein [Panus rudis PR-1116 ss-1]|nr:HECT-domain-containing protein [Panus rudis PR-1116 ss-1]
MDIPLFDHPTKRRREINLGGTHTVASHSAILQEARARRLQRNEEKRKQENATRIQAWWRAKLEVRRVRTQLRQVFEQDPTGITGLRCLVLIGKDEEVLQHWATQILASGQDKLISLLTDPHGSTLLRRTALLLLQSIADHPQPIASASLASALEAILCSSPSSLPPQALQSRRHVVAFLLRRGYYALLSRTISSVPISAKSSSPVLPIAVTLATTPFTVFPVDSDEYKQAVQDFMCNILTVSLLPNRLPIPSLMYLSPFVPLQALHSINIEAIPQLVPDIVSRVHIIANLTAFAPPRYDKLEPAALKSYLQLTTAIMNSLPVHALDPPAPKATSSAWQGDPMDVDSDSDDEPQVNVVESFEPKVVLPDLDNKTRTRLRLLTESKHLNDLLNATHRQLKLRLSLYAWFVALTNVWPGRREKILGAVIVYGGGGLVRELYREYVRPSPLGKDVNHTALIDPAHAHHWPPLLFLVELYTQALRTMGDDEFFSIATGSSAPRNPLTLDELVSFSKQLLFIAFTLYWREDQTNVQGQGVPGMPNLKWEGVRRKATECLQALHDRDSRRKFTPKDHWLVTSQFDIQPFVEAAILEERQIAQPDEVGPRSRFRPVSKRQIASISPRLGVLNNIPFAIPFDVRVSIFRNFVMNDMVSRGYDRYNRRAVNRVTVRRTSIAQDGFDRLGDVDLKSPIAITFVDEFGQEEAGIDGGGVFKEFLMSLCKEVFDTNHGLWLATKNNELYPNPHSYATEAHSLNWYRFIGRILGKALYEGILVDVAFAPFFLAKWLGKQSYLDDLQSLDPQLYQGLIFLKNYTGDPEELSLNFTITIEEFDTTKTIPLIPNGENIPVTRENRLRYILMVSHYRLNKQIRKQSDAFFEGLSDMIDPKWLRMFNQQELQILLGGVNSPIDLNDLRKHTVYGGLYDDEAPTIQLFWKVVNTFDQEQRRKLLRFATSCSRPPLLGFKELVPNFAIRDAGEDENRLPTASTCVNLLKLPRYRSERVLREKLLQAINANAGFDLS